MAVVTIFLTSGSTWTVPEDWNNGNNTVECIGAGADGVQVPGTAASQIGHAGGAGAYAKKSNITLPILSTVSYRVGNTTNSNTWFNGTSLANCSVGAAGANGANGGLASLSVGDVRYSGGNAGGSPNISAGGAAGPHGAGNNGSSSTGGNGDNGWGGAGGVPSSDGRYAGPGSNGGEWGPNLGSGGGGIGSGFSGNSSGGLYGAGGGGSRSFQTSTVPIAYGASDAGNGTPGIIKITYTQLFPGHQFQAYLVGV